jgi:hypothetical protein
MNSTGIVIVIEPVGRHGRFRATLNGRAIVGEFDALAPLISRRWSKRDGSGQQTTLMKQTLVFKHRRGDAMSLCQGMKTGHRSQLRTALVIGDFAIVDPLLVRPFLPETFLTCPYRAGRQARFGGQGSGAAVVRQQLRAGDAWRHDGDYKGQNRSEAMSQ